MINYYRKILSKVLCILMVTSAFMPVFGDVAGSSDYEFHWAREAIQSAMDAGISNGYPDGSFRPDNTITRAEFFSLVNNAFNFTGFPDVTFTDVSSDAWYAPVVANAKAAMYVSGYPDGSVHPEENITRQEAAMIFFKLIKLTPDESSASTFVDSADIASWAMGPIGGVVNASVMKGYPENTFLPDRFLTRAEAIIVIRSSMTVFMTEPEAPLGAPLPSQPIEVLVPVEVISPPTIPSSGSGGGGGGGGGGGTISIPAPVGVSAISVFGEGDASTVIIGGTLQMSVVVTPENAVDKAVSWSVANESGTATIGEDGLLSAGTTGTVTVSAMNPASGITGIKQITITEPNQDQLAPTELLGVAPTSEADNNGKITGTSAAMEFKLSTEPTIWTPASEGEINGLPAGFYNVRYAAKIGFNAGVSADVTVPVFAPANQPAPTGLSGVAPTFALNDGKITGTTSAMEYKISTELTIWTPAPDTAITGLAAGIYNVRYAAKPGFSFGAVVNVTVPVFVPANQPAPTGLVGVAPTTETNNDGKITGTAITMEYKVSTEPTIWSPAPVTAIIGLTPGTYNVRYAAKPGFNAGTAVNITVPAFALGNQPAPTGLAGVAPTSSANNDGRITGTTTLMEYKVSTETNWTPAPGTSITGLASGSYNVRFSAKTGFNPGATANVTVPVFGNQIAEAKLIFTFDDGWQDNLTNALPIMNAAGFKGTMYINRDIINGAGSNIMTYANLNTLYSYGWDLGNHTTDHFDGGNLTDAATLTKLRSIYLDNQNWLLANNWDRGAYHACYPSGMYSNQLIEILKEIGVLTSRSTDESAAGNTQTIPVSNFYKLPTQYVETDSSNLNDVKDSIKYAVDNGTTAILMIHKVQNAAGNLIVTTSDFQAIVTYAKGFTDVGTLSVMTMSEWYTEVAPLSGVSAMMEASTPIEPEESLIVPVTLSSITVKSPAAQLIYNVGDPLDITGLLIEGIYSDGSAKDEMITPDDITGFDSSAEAGSQTLTITVNGQTTEYTIEIKAVPVTLSSIAIKSPAEKLVYNIGDSLDIAGLVIEGTYSDGSIKDEIVTAGDITGFDNSIEATGQMLTIAINGQEASYTVDIKAVPELIETISEE